VNPSGPTVISGESFSQEMQRLDQQTQRAQQLFGGNTAMVPKQLQKPGVCTLGGGAGASISLDTYSSSIHSGAEQQIKCREVDPFADPVGP
jgi:hypothetical protein